MVQSMNCVTATNNNSGSPNNKYSAGLAKRRQVHETATDTEYDHNKHEGQSHLLQTAFLLLHKPETPCLIGSDAEQGTISCHEKA